MPRAMQGDERCVELQAGAHEIGRLTDRLRRYDAAENRRHVLLALFGDDQQREIEQALIAGDRVEAALLARLLVRVRAFEREAHLLAGQITELLEHIDADPSTHQAPHDRGAIDGALTSVVDGARSEACA